MTSQCEKCHRATWPRLIISSFLNKTINERGCTQHTRSLTNTTRRTPCYLMINVKFTKLKMWVSLKARWPSSRVERSYANVCLITLLLESRKALTATVSSRSSFKMHVALWTFTISLPSLITNKQVEKSNRTAAYWNVQPQLFFQLRRLIPFIYSTFYITV